MPTITVGLLGLGRLGASVGLALRRAGAEKGARQSFAITAFDPRPDVLDEARTLGAFDSAAAHAAEAARERDIVVLALPYSAVPGAYRSIGAALRPGAVVLDFSPLKAPSLAWADAHLTTGAYMVGAAAAINPLYLFDGLDDTANAHADLFDNGALWLTPAPKAAKAAVELAADFATLLGAQASFMDAAEHDTLVATTEGVPALLALALFRVAMGGVGWGDAQRLTNPAFGHVTHTLVDQHPDDVRDLLLNNREATAAQIDRLITMLTSLKAVVETGNRAALEAALIEAAQTYRGWLNRRRTGSWDAPPAAASAPSAGSIMSGWIGGALAKRLRPERGDDNGR